MPDTTLQNDMTVASSSVVIETKVSKPLTKKEVRKQLNAEVGPSIKEYFKDAPIMARVAYCESTHTQFAAPGIVHRGKVNNKDVGIFQINEHYHLEDSKDMGIDIYSIEGNMDYNHGLLLDLVGGNILTLRHDSFETIKNSLEIEGFLFCPHRKIDFFFTFLYDSIYTIHIMCIRHLFYFHPLTFIHEKYFRPVFICTILKIYVFHFLNII
jgi:hypothetical protein